MSGVLVIAEQRRGELRPQTLELITAAQGLRRGGALPAAVRGDSAADSGVAADARAAGRDLATGAGIGAAGAADASDAGGAADAHATAQAQVRSGEPEVSVAVIAAAPAEFVPALSLAGVDEIITIEVAAAEFDPETYEAAVGALLAARRPDVVLVAHSVDSFGYAAALAAKHGLGFATDVFDLRRIDGDLVATRGGYGQKVSVEVDFPGRATVLLALRGNVYKAPQEPATPRVTAFAAPPILSRSRPGAFIEPATGDDVDMSGAEFILSIGRGIGEEAKVAQFRDLADAIGATLGCSRPIADAGWLPKSRQVGQSGKTASACKLYIAMGVSGAIQHLAGMKHVSTIVAVNSDANASIFSVAKYGVVGDVFEVAEELRRHF